MSKTINIFSWSSYAYEITRYDFSISWFKRKEKSEKEKTVDNHTFVKVYSLVTSDHNL